VVCSVGALSAGLIAAEALPADSNPATPNIVTAFVRLVRFEACFARDMVAPPWALSFTNTLAGPSICMPAMFSLIGFGLNLTHNTLDGCEKRMRESNRRWRPIAAAILARGEA
jgi:hypothetical protein